MVQQRFQLIWDAGHRRALTHGSLPPDCCVSHVLCDGRMLSLQNGIDVLGCILPAYLDALTDGPASTAGARQAASDQERRAAWRQQRRL